jgi:hypothetical protein
VRRFADPAALALAALLTAGCSSGAGPDMGPRDAAPADLAPDPALLLGFWIEPGSGYVWRYTSDGMQALGMSYGTIDSAPLTAGTWLLRGDTLLLSNTVGLCAYPTANQVGTYAITLGPGKLTFKVISDTCPERSTIDGETWTRYVGD